MDAYLDQPMHLLVSGSRKDTRKWASTKAKKDSAHERKMTGRFTTIGRRRGQMDKRD